MATRDFFRVKSKQLPLRESSTVNSKIWDYVPRGEVIEKGDQNEQGTWVKTTFKGRTGWLFKRCLEKAEPPWLVIARKELGVKEIPGADNNPRVVEYLNATTNLSASVRSKDETPWCSAFVNWVMGQAGIVGTRHALARSWQGWGEHIDEPYVGCIVVFQREQGFGHVGFYLEETETHIKVLGGNQQNPATGIFEVSEKYYSKADFLEYRSPKK
ncbi:MAG: SH3 domain-containing C40 family peptidase [Chloroflexota bacterium]